MIIRVTSALERIRLRRKARQVARRVAAISPLMDTEAAPPLTLNEDEAKALDAYYTRPHVAEFVANVVRTFAPKNAVYLEPSAGGGAILDQFPGAIGLDLWAALASPAKCKPWRSRRDRDQRSPLHAAASCSGR